MTQKPLSEVLNSAPTATSLSGLSMLLKDSSGGLAQTGAMLIDSNPKIIADFDTLPKWGIFYINAIQGQTLNAPVYASNMVAVCLGLYQTVLRSGEGGHIYFRVNNVDWQSWKTVV